MKAIRYEAFGGPEVLEITDIPVPEPKSDQIRVAVRAAGVNPIDWKIRSGGMPDFPVTFPAVPGLEIAGVVEAVGADVDGFAVGDAVFGWSIGGGYAESALAERVFGKPEHLSWTDAVALPIAVEAASRGLGLLSLRPGEVVVVHGAAGAVGTAAVQLARKAGATVVGTAGAKNLDYVRSLGALATTYGEGLVERVQELAPGGVDAALDAAGHGALPALIELIGGPDRVVTIVDAQLAGTLGVTFTGGAVAPSLDRIAEVAELVAAGEFTLPPPREFPLGAAAAAQTESERGSGLGKIVLIP